MKSKRKFARRQPGSEPAPAVHIDSVIHTIRGERIILDVDLATIYGVETRSLNQAVKRNKEKFPDDFLFQLTQKEVTNLQRSRSQIVTLNREANRSQFVTGSQKHRDPRALPYAFTEHGAPISKAKGLLKAEDSSNRSDL